MSEPVAPPRSAPSWWRLTKSPLATPEPRDVKLQTAVAEAERFLARANDLQDAQIAEPGATHPREAGAVRRASMDLTRALADLRRRGE